MTRDEFSRGMLHLRAAFSKAKIPPQEADIIYSELSTIPSIAWTPITALAIQKWDAWPKNLIKEVKELWRSWLSSNPQYQTPLQASMCYECHASTGFIWGRKLVDDLSSPQRDYYVTAVFRCAHCDNAQSSKAVPRYTRQQITELGYTIDDTGRYSPHDDFTVHKRRHPIPTLKPVPPPLTPADLETRRQEQKRALDQYMGERDDEVPF